MTSLLVLTPVILALASGGAPQSLAEAAKRAEDQRKSNQGQAIKIDKLSARSGEVAVSEVPLDKNVLDRYVKVREGLSQLMHRDSELYLRVHTQAMVVPTFRDFGDVLAAEPAVVEVLQYWGFTPKYLVAVELTLRRATRRTEGGYGKISELEEANTEFAGRHLGYLGVLPRHWQAIDKGLTYWPDWVAD